MARTPLLVLAAGQRSGSTLLQRLLTSHAEVLIWGEHGGHLGPILAGVEGMGSYADEFGRDASAEFSHSGHNGWMANLTPDAERVATAARSFVEALFAEPAAAMGRPVWGLKEVRYGLSDAERLRRLFPETAVILLVRDPRDVLCSLDEWERLSGGLWVRGQTVDAVANWLKVASGFASTEAAVLRLRYEDIVLDPKGTCELLGAHVGLDPADFDPDVFARRVHIGERLTHLPRDLRPWAALPADLRGLLDAPEIRRAAAACGYFLEGVHDGQ